MTRTELEQAIDAFGRPVPVFLPMSALRKSLAAARAWDAANPNAAAERYALCEQLEALNAEARQAQIVAAALRKTGAGESSLAVLAAPTMTPALIQTTAWLNETPPSWALVLRGPVGTGKTIAARWAIAELLRREGAQGQFRRTSEVLRLSAFDAGPRELHALKRAPMLVLDDVGADALSDYGRSVLLELLDARYERRPHARTVLTANPGWEELKERLGQRIVDRIRDGGRVVDLDGTSMRGRPKLGLVAGGAK